ncbi:hypothetical protein F1D05_14355 [Kribbella qitaiheensis]|uniref:Recombinase family protein n=1 Tax=Kribbella qitaiheensis TaxID=1544730 RepID=A0A7G6WY08_9ACTN|nr:hypothetical protein [Kribbella qitaiheensis]QNE18873.1 hypothetical protein F1D05_14355 [Kribbella qitaiheensis]
MRLRESLNGGIAQLGTHAIFGYFKKSSLMGASESAAMHNQIFQCAENHCLVIDAIYIDEIETAPARLTALIATLTAADERVMILPNLLHLASLGNPYDVRADIEGNGIRVLIARR